MTELEITSVLRAHLPLNIQKHLITARDEIIQKIIEVLQQLDNMEGRFELQDRKRENMWSEDLNRHIITIHISPDTIHNN